MFSSRAAPTSLAEATSSRGEGFPAATPAASAAPRGGGHSSHVSVWSGAYFVGRGDIFTRRGFSRRDTGGVNSSAWGGHSSHVFVWSGAYFVGRGDIFTRRGFSRRDTGGVSSSAWGGAFLPCFRLERRLLRWQRRHLHAAGVFPPRHRRRQQLRVGGHSSHVSIWSGAHFVSRGDIFTRREFSRRGTGGVSSSAWGGHSSHVFI